MTEQQKETMRRNREARAKARAERDAQEAIDKAATVEVLRTIRDDPTATVTQKIFAIVTLDELLYYRFVPYCLKSSSVGAVDLAAFKKAVDELTAQEAAKDGQP